MPMSSVRSMGEEIRHQLEDLPVYRDYLVSSHPSLRSEAWGRNCIFVGAGDSFIASLATEYLSQHLTRAMDPYELSLDPTVATDKHVYFVSVSGRTRGNIDAAQKVRRRARRLTAITADVNSPLAAACDDVIELRVHKSPEPTPGTLSFTASLLACFSRIMRLPKFRNLEGPYERASGWSKDIGITKDVTTYFVGSELSYAIAMYGAAKVFEVLGSKAQYQRTEQFSHMELFSLSRRDLIVIIQSGAKDDPKAQTLRKLLHERGFTTAAFETRAETEVEHAIYSSLYLQLLVWRNAYRLGLEEASFRLNTELLQISNSMIY